ncbi:MAG: LAGLIDADG family homing endonuclease, partial [Nanoarchaeota archaeon]|nr:LAGLIDADG family homing endonuclease [Nanoarchaeota archaeon]
MAIDIIVGRNEADKKKFGTKGTILIAKNYVKMGRITTLSNPVYMDVIRSHVVFVVGKRGSGKCVTGDTIISLADGSQVPIKDLENIEASVCGINNKLKISSLKKSDFFKRSVDRILHVKLRSGKEIKLTPNHPLFTIKGWKPVEELKIGSRIATPRRIPYFSNEVLPDHEVKLWAYFIAEGHTMQSWVLFSNKDPIIFKDFEESVNNFDSNLEVREHSKPGCYRVVSPDNRYSFKKNPVKTWLKSYGLYGTYAKEKWLPNELFNLKRDKIGLFLNRLFSCDGSVYPNSSRNGWEIDYSSSSKQLIQQVHHLLLRFGILSKIRLKKVKYDGRLVDSYELIINQANCVKFIEEIGFFGRKEGIAAKCLSEIKDVIRNPNVDTIPKEVWDLYRPSNWAEVGRKVGYAHPKAMRERIRYCPSRQTMLQVAEADQNESIKLLAQSDIFWDEIVFMEELEGEFDVYDICVPNYHNFVANDIIVHNSYSSSVIAEGMVD